MNLDNVDINKKDYIEKLLEHPFLGNKNINDLNFGSIETKHIRLIIGEEEFISLSLLGKEDELKNYNLISISDPFEKELPIELYEKYNNYLKLNLFDINKDIDKLLFNKKISQEEYDFLKSGEINEEHFKELINFVNENKNNKFIINCQAGISRSSAIGYILEDILNKNLKNKNEEQEKILNFWRYLPNKMIIEKFTKKEFNNIHENEDIDLKDIF